MRQILAYALLLVGILTTAASGYALYNYFGTIGQPVPGHPTLLYRIHYGAVMTIGFGLIVGVLMALSYFPLRNAPRRRRP